MITTGREKGLLLFGLIVVIAAIAAIAAYQMTGNKGFEDRFSEAVGLPLGGEEGGPALFGFSVEGNPSLYLAVLGTLLFISYLLYRRFIAKTGLDAQGETGKGCVSCFERHISRKIGTSRCYIFSSFSEKIRVSDNSQIHRIRDWR